MRNGGRYNGKPMLMLAMLWMQDADPQRAYEAMVAKVEAASTLAGKITIQAEPTTKDGAPMTMTWSISICEPGQMLMAVATTQDKKTWRGRVVVDGGRTQEAREGGGERTVANGVAHKKAVDAGVAVLARVGMAGSSHLTLDLVGGGKAGRLTPEEFLRTLKVEGFKGGKREKLGTREAIVIEYTASAGEGVAAASPVAVKTWIDAETNLPLRREAIGKMSKAMFSFVETYDEMSLDVKISDATFEFEAETKKP